MDSDKKMNRRDALKYMGTICAGAFLVSSGVLAMPGHFFIFAVISFQTGY